MVHLLMVHLPMVHLHVLHLLAMHLIGLQLVQCIDTPTVVFRLQLIMHQCKPLGGSKQELEEREQVMRRRTHGGTLAWVISIPSLEQEVGTITTGSHGPGHNYHRVSTFGTTINYQIWDNHTEYFILLLSTPSVCINV